MKNLFELAKSTALGGFFVLLPILILLLLLEEVFGLVVAMATPIADLFPQGMFDNLSLPTVVAVILLLGLSTLIGIAMRLPGAQGLGEWLEHRVLGKLPAYKAIRSVTRSLSGSDTAQNFKPVLFAADDGGRQIAYLVEQHGNGLATIMLPVAPTPFAGKIRVVSMDRLEALNASLADVTASLSHWGVGVRQMMDATPELSGELSGQGSVIHQPRSGGNGEES